MKRILMVPLVVLGLALLFWATTHNETPPPAPWDDPNLTDQARAEAIWQSKLTDDEKGELVFKLVRVGMSEEDFEKLMLGSCGFSTASADGPLNEEENYSPIAKHSSYGFSVGVRDRKIISKSLTPRPAKKESWWERCCKLFWPF